MKTISKKNSVCSSIKQFLVSVKELNLVYFASDAAREMKFEDSMELYNAIRRAIDICTTSGISVETNFKMIQKDSTDNTTHDWRLSRIAYNLVCLNGNPSNPKVAIKQVELLRNQIINF